MIAEALLALSLAAPAPADTLTVEEAVEIVRTQSSGYLLPSACPAAGSFDQEVWRRVLDLSLVADRPWDSSDRPILPPRMVGVLLIQQCETLPLDSWFVSWFTQLLRHGVEGQIGIHARTAVAFFMYRPDGARTYERILLSEARDADDLASAVTAFYAGGQYPLVWNEMASRGAALGLLRRLTEADAPVSEALRYVSLRLGAWQSPEGATAVLRVLEQARPARPAELLPVLEVLRSALPAENRARLDALRVRLGVGGGV